MATRKVISVIIDPAHGSNVSGKCSPDGTHKEYKWSREVGKMIEVRLIALGYDIHWTTHLETEPGLSARKNAANNITIPKGNVKFLISNHNNAAGADGKWHNAEGVEIWTSKGRSTSDVFADFLISSLYDAFNIEPIKFRYDNTDGDKDKEENFTVLMGNYFAVLIEWLFQDNAADVTFLKNKQLNEKYADAVVAGIEKCNEFIIKKLG